MELYAAMVSNLDGHIGRLMDYLKTHDLYENTLIVVLSDNGAAGEDFYNDPAWGEYFEYTRANYDNSQENMGGPDSFVSYGLQWAEAGSAPFHRYKGYTRQGGVTAPMIISGPRVAGSGAKSTAYLTVMDLAPTFLEMAGAEYPAGGTVRAMRGESLVALLAGETAAVHGEEYVTVHSHSNRMLIRKGRWKLTNLDGPFDEANLELFDLERDPGETTNLAAARPEKFRELLELWREQRRELGIVLPQDL